MEFASHASERACVLAPETTSRVTSQHLPQVKQSVMKLTPQGPGCIWPIDDHCGNIALSGASPANMACKKADARSVEALIRRAKLQRARLPYEFLLCFVPPIENEWNCEHRLTSQGAGGGSFCSNCNCNKRYGAVLKQYRHVVQRGVGVHRGGRASIYTKGTRVGVAEPNDSGKCRLPICFRFSARNLMHASASILCVSVRRRPPSLSSSAAAATDAVSVRRRPPRCHRLQQQQPLTLISWGGAAGHAPHLVHSNEIIIVIWRRSTRLLRQILVCRCIDDSNLVFTAVPPPQRLSRAAFANSRLYLACVNTDHVFFTCSFVCH